MARISACAVGSWRATGAFQPLPAISPAIATTAPTGTSPAAAPARARRIASRMNSSSGRLKSPAYNTEFHMAELEIHHEGGNEPDPGGQRVGVLAAVLAVLLAIVTIASHRTHTAAIIHKSTANDEWAHYQATRVKYHRSEEHTSEL